MQFINLSKQFHQNRDSINKAISKCLESSSFILGKEVARLEDRLAEFTNAKFCLAVANGTDALDISERAIGISADDNVIIPSFTWVSTAETVKIIGSKIKFADVNEKTFNIKCSAVENLIDEKTKIVIGVSIFGQTCDLMQLKTLAEKNNIYFIEDAAQSFGAFNNNSISCSVADISTTSFFPSKPLGGYGDGGAIFTSNEELYKKCKLLARHGQNSSKEFLIAGFNSRLDEIQAAILNVKLDLFEKEVELRQNVAQMYKQYLSECPEIITPFIQEGNKSVYAQYTILLPDTNYPKKIQAILKEKGIPSVIYYSPPVHQHPGYFNENQEPLPITESITKMCLSLPFDPYLDESDIKRVSLSTIEALKSIRI